MPAKIFKSVILGAPAAGKTTIATKLAKTFKLEHISSGDKLRQHIQNNTAIGIEAKKYTKEGKLVPDDIMIKFICEEIDKVRPTWLLDGFPRTVAQVKALWDIHKLDMVINLVIPFQVLIDRIKGRLVHLPSGRVYNTAFNSPKVPGKDDVTGEPLVQREDDKPHVFQKRLEQYDTMTRPVIEFYSEKQILQNFNGTNSNEVLAKINHRMAKSITVKDP